jgi:hypothetical protein
MSSTPNNSRSNQSNTGLVFTLVGWFCGTILLAQTFAAIESAGWETTTGTVTSSWVHETFDIQSGTTQIPVVGYEYVVNGTMYSSGKLSFRPRTTILSWIGGAEPIVNRYPVGRTVPVHYDPTAPMNAVLEAGVSWVDFVLLIVVFGAGPALLIAAHVRRRSG